ncbi:MAG: hypothetical protein ABIA62_00165 [Candidatus Woesearchaeota archaeon]
MDIHIMRISDAVMHLPERPTYAIRIASPGFDNLHKFPLEDSKLYIKIAEYLFDDADDLFREPDSVMFDTDIADRMLEDFELHKDDCESLLVHCSRGRNRSPAVAIAFNEIFGLGNSKEYLRKKYPEYNRLVYDVLKRVAEQR